MSTRSVVSVALLLAVTCACVARTSRAGAETCGAAGTMTFICGADAAEDIVAVPGTHWLVASGLGFGAPNSLKRIDSTTGRVEVLYPAGATNRLDERTYPACPGPPDAATFSTDVWTLSCSVPRPSFAAPSTGGGSPGVPCRSRPSGRRMPSGVAVPATRLSPANRAR